MVDFDRPAGLVGSELLWGLAQHRQAELRRRGICNASARKESTDGEAYLVKLDQSWNIVSPPLQSIIWNN